MAWIEGDDGLPAGEVGAWVKEKHGFLKRYLDISRATRQKFIGPRRAGATYIDLFCATGRAKIKGTNEWVDGSAVAAWKISVDGGARFTEMIISDIDPIARSSCAHRLRELGAPVREIAGSALEASSSLPQILNAHGLHFAFIDPYSLGALNFEIIRSLSYLKRMDMMIHVSAMDLQRNLDKNVAFNDESYDEFAPGWRENVDLMASQPAIRQAVINYWRGLVSGLGALPAAQMKLISGSKNQPLYWLLIAAKHELARSFWEKAVDDGQGKLL